MATTTQSDPTKAPPSPTLATQSTRTAQRPSPNQSLPCGSQKLPQTLTCQTCHEEFQWTPTSNNHGKAPPKYCNNNCRQAAWRTKMKTKIQPPRTNPTCALCGQPFQWTPKSKTGRVPPKYCSDVCRKQVWHQKILPQPAIKKPKPQFNKQQATYLAEVQERITTMGGLETYLQTRTTTQEERRALKSIAYTANTKDHEFIWRYLNKYLTHKS